MNSLLKKYYANFRHPKGLLGRLVVYRMNGKAHAALAEWALESVNLKSDFQIADIGCGGGANIARMLERCPEGRVAGVDFAPVAIRIATKVNQKAIDDKRCKIVGGNAKLLPFVRDTFDLVTAFETVYYWPALEESLIEISRVLKAGGKVLIANNSDGTDPEGQKWIRQVGHMYIYTIDELKEHLTRAGFIDITARHDEQTHRICVIGTKPQEKAPAE